MNSDLIKLLSDLGKTTVAIRGHAVTVRRLNARDEMTVQKMIPPAEPEGDTPAERREVMGGLPFRAQWIEKEIRQRALRVAIACGVHVEGANELPRTPEEANKAADLVLGAFSSDELLLLEAAANGHGKAAGAASADEAVLKNSSAPSRLRMAGDPMEPPVLIEETVPAGAGVPGGGVSLNGTG